VITRRWQRVTLLGVLGYEAAGAVLGGSLLAAVPDGRLIDMPVDIMEGTFHDFFIPGLILLGLGILNAAAFVAVFRRHRADWILAGLASGGLAVWFGVEIAVLQQLHWLHAMWGLPVVLGGMVALPLVPARHATLRNALLACGIVASLLYVTATILGAMRYPGYHFTSHTVSELFAIDAPSKALVDPLLVAYSLLWIAFGVGVWLSAGRSLALRIAAAGLIGKEIEGVVVQLFFPMHQRGVAATSNDPMHGVLTYVGVVSFLVAMGFGAMAFGTWFRRYSIGTLLVCLAFAILTGLEVPRMVANQPTPWMGVWERITIFGYLLWGVVLAILLRAHGAIAPRQLDKLTQLETPPSGDLRHWLARQREHLMTTRTAFIRRQPVLTYFTLTFAISWGGFLLAGGSGLFAGTSWRTDPAFLVAVQVMLAGPPIAGLLMTVLVSGTAGLRELLSRLLKWRVGGRWYAVALLTAPILEIAVLLALSRVSPVFLPAIVTSDDKAALLASGIAIGLAGGFAEELGWTGFAIPRLLVRHSAFAIGVIVGPLWVAWHLLQMLWVGATSSETLPLALFLPLFFLSAVATLTAYRVLMVWVYERTGSLLVAILMHASYIFSTLFVLAPPTTGLPFLTYSGAFAAALWVVVAAVAVADHAHFTQQPLRKRAA